LVLLALIIVSAALPVSHVKAVAGPASPNDILSSCVGDLKGFRYVGPLPGNINVTGVLYVPLDSSGSAFIEVSGSYNGSWASYDVEVFVGYFGNRPLPTPMYPYLPYLGVPLAAFATSPAGAPGNVSMRVDVLRYNPLNNTYTEVYSQPIGLGTSSVNFTASPGYYIIKVSGQAYGLTPIYVGYLMQLFILAPSCSQCRAPCPREASLQLKGSWCRP
jgi:hypothetical protein